MFTVERRGFLIVSPRDRAPKDRLNTYPRAGPAPRRRTIPVRPTWQACTTDTEEHFVKIIVLKDDGTSQDITSLVQVAFDVATHSMDWGSGFLDVEETDGLILLAEACQFPALEEILQEQWRDRWAEGKTWDEKHQEAHARGADRWYYAKPTPEEREQFLNDMKRKYMP